jgi:hypothetical protein
LLEVGLCYGKGSELKTRNCEAKTSRPEGSISHHHIPCRSVFFCVLSAGQKQIREGRSKKSAARCFCTGDRKISPNDMQPYRIPWAALKSVWRRGDAIPCQNCDQPTIMVNFGETWTGLFRQSPRFVYVCGACRRSYRDESVRDVWSWIEEHLDAQVRPDCVMIWDRRERVEDVDSGLAFRPSSGFNKSR